MVFFLSSLLERALKIKTTAKLNSEQILIAMARDLYRMDATFLPTPPGSHYRLRVPLKFKS
jgi:hypothetical protein